MQYLTTINLPYPAKQVLRGASSLPRVSFVRLSTSEKWIKDCAFKFLWKYESMDNPGRQNVGKIGKRIVQNLIWRFQVFR